MAITKRRFIKTTSQRVPIDDASRIDHFSNGNILSQTCDVGRWPAVSSAFSKLPVPGQMFQKPGPPIFSSRGTKWAGLPVELREMLPGTPLRLEAAEHRIVSSLSSANASWTASGVGKKGGWKPRTCIFKRKACRLDNVVITARTEYISVSLDDERVSQFFHDDIRASRADFIGHTITSDDQAVGLINSMFAEVRAGNPAGDLFAESVSVALLSHVYGRYDRSGTVKRLEGRLSQRQIETIVRNVKERVANPPSVSELADLLQLSPGYFCTAFSKTLGVTPYRFILNHRIEVAKALLQEPSVPPFGELSGSLGFANQAHFSSAFRKLVGCTPSGFRRRVK